MAIETDHPNIFKLITGDLIEFHIPIYQRTYTWDAKEHIDKLLDDIKEFGEEYKDNDRAEYYIGNIIIKNQTSGLVTERVVIDGQQRITTTILILCVIRDIHRQKFPSEQGEKTANMIQKSLYQEEGQEVKLKLNNMEHQQTLTNLLSSKIDNATTDKKTRYYKNYKHIYKRFSGMSEADFNNFLNLLQRVKVVVISLDKDQDENSVFESINSLGKSLAGSDLIKNYLFTFKNYQCSREDETDLTEHYTRNFESLFKNEKEVEQELETFFRIYIAIETTQLVKKDPKAIYYGFKKHIDEIRSVDRCKEIISDLTKRALLYQTLRVRNHPDIDSNHLGFIRSSFSLYSTLLIQMLEHYSHIDHNEVIIDDKNEFNRALKAVVAYDAARFIANYSTNEIARFIPRSLKQAKDAFPTIQNDGDRFIALISKIIDRTYINFPNIDDLEKLTLENNLYSRKRNPLKQFLILLENIDKKECLPYEQKAQIEHIMPQTLNQSEWPDISQQEHQKLLHTLGNLTLTLDNQELSNLSFTKKKQILMKKSRFKLNSDLAKYDEFKASQIQARGKELIEKFINAYLKPYKEILGDAYFSTSDEWSIKNKY